MSCVHERNRCFLFCFHFYQSLFLTSEKNCFYLQLSNAGCCVYMNLFLKFYLFIYLIQQVLIIYFIHISVYMSIPISQFIPLPAQEATFVQYKDPSILRD